MPFIIISYIIKNQTNINSIDNPQKQKTPIISDIIPFIRFQYPLQIQTIIQLDNKKLMKIIISFLLFAFLIAPGYSGVVPTKQILLYPNTQSSPSLYLISFKTSINLIAGQYIMISMDWLSASIDPFSCILVNSTIGIRCSNLASPTFTLGFPTTTLQNHNIQLVLTKSVIIELLNPLPANTNYFLEIGLVNLVENIKKISPSLQFYCLSRNGLIYEQNLNFGPVTYKPPITNLLGLSIYTDINDLALGIPGKLVTLKAQITITVPIVTALSSMFFVLQHPFEFSVSSYITVEDAQQYSTNPIALNKKPTISFFSVLTPHIFYVAFNQSFLANRRFILHITQIKNPFFIANSNVSIYTANFNSLTPLQAFQRLFPLKTVTQTLTLDLGLPFDMPMVGPCVFYRNLSNYYQVKFYMPLSVPQGYAIKVLASENTILDGTGFVNFQSLNYTTVYDYFTDNYFIMRQMGPILQGSLITIVFKASKNAITNFYIDIYIDTQQVINAGIATSYMFSGRVTAQSVDASSFFSDIYSSVQNQPLRVDTAMTTGHYLALFIAPTALTSTSSGSYIEIYLSPQVQFAAGFNAASDCTFGSTPFSAQCAVTKTANMVKISFTPTTLYSITNPNAFPVSSIIQLRISNIRFPTPSSAKYPYHIYMSLFKSSVVNPITYIQAVSFSVLPQSNTLTVSLTQQGNVNTTDTYKYPAFIRFACTLPSQMDYILQQNQVRVISIFSTYGMRGQKTYNNQQEYPCSSNQPITCIFKKGILANGDLEQTNRFSEIERVDIFFKNGSTETTDKFHIILPDGINVGSGGTYYMYFYMIGIYNTLTKVYTYKYRNSGFTRDPTWALLASTLSTTMEVNFEGKAGSYKQNVTVSVDSTDITLSQTSYLVMSSAWSLFQNGKSAYTSTTTSTPDPQFYTVPQLSPLSVNMGQGMYLSVFPFKMTASLSSFTFTVDNLHLPYHYDLQNFYIYTISSSQYNVIKSNQFQMTNQGIFYSTYLKSLGISCVKNSLGVKNTRCSIVFQPQNPLKADGKLTFSFSGINVATSICSVYLQDMTKLQSSCSSTSDNKNVTISMVDSSNCYHYIPQNFVATIDGISIISTQISQSVTVYLTDSSGNYIIEQGTRILTTTVSVAQDIQIYEITYKYSTPLSANKMKIRFSLPRTTYPDQRLGFVMGKDLSDVNLQVSRMKIVLTKADGTIVLGVYELISSEYKVLFSFTDSSQLTATSYTMQIYGIMTPVSLQNGAFSIIYQRGFDKAFTLTNAINTPFPSFQARIISNIQLESFFNTEGYEQKLIFTLVNSWATVNSNMVWIVNFPSYYNSQLFNYQPYCMIDTTPIQCHADPTTPYQLIIRNSPKIVTYGTTYTISVHRLTSPRAKYTNDYYRSYYLFIGVLTSITSEAYVQTALLYPQQTIQQTINNIITVSDVTLNSLTNPSFSSVYTIFKLVCNTDITSGSYLYLIFPYEFDNFNNHPINFIFKVGGSILFSSSASVIDRTLEISITTTVATNTQFFIQFPSLPTPKVACSVKMSQTIAFATTSTKKSIYAASSIAGNSAPILTFIADTRYISFNHDNIITLTAGTYSQMIDISSSDGNAFLTNIVVNLTSSGFTFEPASVFLKLGDPKAQFRVGADSGLFPISYFYDAVKSEQIYTYYTITTNNNIMVTNNPIIVTIPASINVPVGGCSVPFTVDILNPPVIGVQVAFIYNNQIYNQSIFYPNSHTTKSQLSYTPQITQNIVSFCASSSFSGLPTTFIMRFSFSGSNYKSYQFSPNQNVTINIVPAIAPNAIPAVNLIMINQQKTFIDFNITPTLAGIVYYQLQLGQNIPAIDITQHQIYLKNNQFTIESNNDFMSTMYTQDRDVRIGINIRTSSGVYTLRMNNMLPERFYTFCAYFQTFYNIITAPKCINVNTQQWGSIMKARLSFTSALTPANFNKVLCYFAKSANTQVIYAVDLQGNSCHNTAVDNLYYQYPGQTFTSQTSQTYIYLITNPTFSSDPSPTAFQNMFTNAGQLSAASLSSALSGFAINYLSAGYEGTSDAISMTDNNRADDLVVSFDDPIYNRQAATIAVNNVGLSYVGTVYFVLVLYKQVHIDGNNSYVRIRLNQSPNQHQMLNCMNWQNMPAEGCARAVYSFRTQNVVFNNIRQNCMYMLYYMAASQYPLRPIVSSNIKSDSVVTFVHEKRVQILVWVMLALLVVIF